MPPQPSTLNTICLTLLEATLTLYPANAIGEPMLDQPLWMGTPAHDLSVRDRWIKVQTRPSGSKFPRNRPLVPQFEISIGRLWALPLSQLAGFIPDRGRYVLDIVWREEDTDDWHREVFYGVTISERDRAARDRDGEFTENQVFDAEYFVGTNGVGTPPAIPPTLTYSVRYVSASENLELYGYNPDTDLFTESAGSPTTTRATLTYTPDHTGYFDVLFAGNVTPSLRVNAAGQVEVYALRQGSPTQADMPRVEFWYGQNRVAAVTRSGTLLATRFLTLNPLSGDKFQFFASSTLALTFEAAAATGNFTVFTPQLVSGLKLWTRAESLGQSDLAMVDLWPDESGNGNDLSQGGSLLTLAGEELLTQSGEPLLYQGSNNGNAPAFVMSPAEDEWNHHALPVTGGALRFLADEFLRTSGTIFDADNHCLFVVACPFTPAGGVLVARTMVSGDAGTNQFTLKITDTQRARAEFSPDFLGSPNLNTATGPSLCGEFVGAPAQLIGWHLFEMEAAARRFTPNITSLDLIGGTLPVAVYNYVIVDVLPSGQLSYSEVSSFDLAGAGGIFQFRVQLPAATPGATSRLLYRNKVTNTTDFYLRATLSPSATSYADNMSMATFAATNPAAITAPSRAGFLTLSVDGTQQATVADLVGLATDTQQPVQVGAASGGFWGYMKAVLLYEGNPSTADKERIRRFLNNAYSIY